ncbi:MAG: M48 family metallopeptidase, partial [Thermomicrobiales bacterium]
GHLVDRRFGVTRQSGSAWLAEQIKSLMIGLLVQTPLLTGCFVLMRRRPRDWWLIAAAASVPLATAFSYLAPVLIMPRFNRFDLLDDRGLESEIRQLSEKSGVRISNVYRMDMSRQTEKPNAFFAGIGTTKRIVLSDTLLEQFPEGEITAVVAHELGHQAHGDIWRLTGFASAAGFAVAWLFARFAPGVVRATARFTDVDEMGDEAAFPLLALQMTGFGVILMPILAAYSRSLERGADRFAVALTGDNVVYAQALERLGALGLADPDPHPLVVFLLYSHPPLGERIRSALGERANVAPPAVAGT